MDCCRDIKTGKGFGGVPQKHRQYKMKIRVGECNQCGACCDNERARAVMNRLSASGIPYTVAPHFPCYHSHFEDGKCVCEIYNHRPQFCRGFPFSEDDLIDYLNVHIGL